MARQKIKCDRCPKFSNGWCCHLGKHASDTQEACEAGRKFIIQVRNKKYREKRKGVVVQESENMEREVKMSEDQDESMFVLNEVFDLHSGESVKEYAISAKTLGAICAALSQQEQTEMGMQWIVTLPHGHQGHPVIRFAKGTWT